MEPVAAQQDDELLLVICCPLLAPDFTPEMDQLWMGAELGVTARLERNLQENIRRCVNELSRK